MHFLSWLQDTFGNRKAAPSLETQTAASSTDDQIEKTRRARRLFYREIDRTLPGGMDALRRAAFPIADQLEGDGE